VIDPSNLNDRINIVFNKPHYIASRTYYNQEIRLYKVNREHFAEVWYMPGGEGGIHKVDFISRPKLELYI